MHTFCLKACQYRCMEKPSSWIFKCVLYILWLDAERRNAIQCNTVINIKNSFYNFTLLVLYFNSCYCIVLYCKAMYLSLQHQVYTIHVTSYFRIQCMYSVCMVEHAKQALSPPLEWAWVRNYSQYSVGRTTRVNSVRILHAMNMIPLSLCTHIILLISAVKQ